MRGLAVEDVVAVLFDFGTAVSEPVWFRPLFTKMAGLLDLPPNWNSHGARPVDVKAVELALNLLLETMKTRTPLPSIVPLPEGGLQMEWHDSGIDFEVAVLPPDACSLYLEGIDRLAPAGGILELEGGIEDVRGTAAQALAEITRRSGS